MAVTNMNYLPGMCVILLSCVFGLLGEVLTEEQQTSNVFDPMASMHIRQEATLRKLDTLLVKLNQMDSMESKLADVTKLLEEQLEKNQMLEDKLEAMQLEIKVLNSGIKQMNFSLDSIETRLENESYCKSENFQKIVSSLQNVTEASRQIISEGVSNLTMISELAAEEVKTISGEAMMNLTSAAHILNTNGSEVIITALTSEIMNKLTSLEGLMTSNSNDTKHLFSATFRRIRISNHAMDKRLGALLHMSSSRQSVLQDSLLTALTSVASLVKTQTQDVIRKTESRFENLELSMKTSVILHTKEIAAVVLEAANQTYYDVSSTTLTRLEGLLLQVHLNQSSLLEDSLQVMRELYNRTQQRDTLVEYNHLCIIPLDNQSDSSILADDQINHGFLEGNLTEDALLTLNQTDSDSLEHARTSIRQIEDYISSAQSALSEQITTLAEQMLGMRIYYSTSLHMSQNEIVSAIDDVGDEVTRKVEETIGKTTRHLDKLRHSAFGLMDAAVSSITSSSVASAQVTADQLQEVIESLQVQLGSRLDKLQSMVNLLILVCPPNYTRVGNICLLTFQDALTSWYTARDLCQQEDGDLVVIPDEDMLGHLKAFLYTTHANEATPPPPYWLGGRLLEEQWIWTNGSSIGIPLSEVSQEADEASEGSFQTQGECLMTWGAGIEIVPGDCEALKGVLCEFHQSNRLSQSSSSKDVNPPKTTGKPFMIIDPVFTNALATDDYDSMVYTYP